MRGFDEQLKSRKVVLRKVIDDGPVRWRDVISGTAQQTGSPKTSQSSLEWLLDKGYINRIKRGVYEGTEKGVKFLKAFNS